MLACPIERKWLQSRKICFLNQKFGENRVPFYKQMGMLGHNGIDVRTQHRLMYLYHNVLGFVRKDNVFTSRKAGRIKTQASFDGEVLWAGADKGGGIGVRYQTAPLVWDKEDTDMGDGSVLKTGDKFRLEILHYHLDKLRPDVIVGKKVKRREILGVCGNSGRYTTGPHLHYGVRLQRWDGKKYASNMKNGYNGYVNPLPFMDTEVRYV